MPFSDYVLRFEAFLTRHRKRILTGIFLFFGIGFSLISLVNHYAFRTYGFDLGLFNNAIYDYAHFRWNDNSVKLYHNILSDHFTLLHIPFSLFYWVFGSYTLLVFQILALLFGAWGAYKFHLLVSGRPGYSIILQLHFLATWGIYSALSYDYHDNIVGAMMVPWFFYYFFQEKWRKALFFFVILLISKENMALWAVFIGAGLAVKFFKEKPKFRHALAFSALAAVYFIIVVKFIIPSLAVGERSYDYVNKYEILGKGFSDIIISSLKDPLRVIRFLFENHTDDPTNDGIKLELHLMILVSGGIALLFRPAYLLMLIPIYAQKLYTNHELAWGINYQYAIEFVPVINFALADLLRRLDAKKSMILGIGAFMVTGYFTGRSFHHRKAKYLDKAAFQFYQAKHYQNYFDIREAHRALKLIPDDVPVSASSQFVPHLAFREYIFEYPVMGNAQYLVYLLDKYPEHVHDPEVLERMAKVEMFRTSGDWETIYNKNYMLILKRKPGTPDVEKVIFK